MEIIGISEDKIKKISDIKKIFLTHAHPDHIGMCRQFERVFVNRKELGQEALYGQEQDRGPLRNGHAADGSGSDASKSP